MNIAQCACIDFYSLLSLSFVIKGSDEVEVVRYANVDRRSGFQFIYENMESDQMVFPGKLMLPYMHLLYELFYVYYSYSSRG